jgi:hypothetical protein
MKSQEAVRLSKLMSFALLAPESSTPSHKIVPGLQGKSARDTRRGA